MATLPARFAPFRDLVTPDAMRGLEDFFRDFRLMPNGAGLDAEPRIRMDVSEGTDAYTVKAEIPGVRKEDIQVSIDGSTVSISAETRREHEEKQGDRVVRSERYQGRQSRRFTLDHDIDPAKASAHYRDGILELTLPKTPGAARVRKLTIS